MSNLTQPTDSVRTPEQEIAAISQRILKRHKETDDSCRESEQRDKLRQAALFVNKLEADLGRRYRPEVASLDKFKIYHESQRKVLAALRDLMPRLSVVVSEGRGLILYGPVGTGKDHLIAAMLYEIASRGVEARWFNGQEIAGAFRDRIDTKQRDEEYFRELCKPTVLAISDPIPPAGQVGSWNTENLYRLLDRRYRAEKSTWVSLNAASIEDADAKLSAPVFDRLRDGAEVFPCFWPSYRERRRGQ